MKYVRTASAQLALGLIVTPFSTYRSRVVRLPEVSPLNALSCYQIVTEALLDSHWIVTTLLPKSRSQHAKYNEMVQDKDFSRTEIGSVEHED